MPSDLRNVSGDLLTLLKKSANVSANSCTCLPETCTRDQLLAQNSSERRTFGAGVRYIRTFWPTRLDLTNVSADLHALSMQMANVSANLRTGLTETCTRDPLWAQNSSERLTFRAGVRYIRGLPMRLWQSRQAGAGSGIYAIEFVECLG